MTATRQRDAIDILLAQHEQIRELFGQVTAADGARRREMFADLVRLLAVHEAAEEELVHPMARKGGVVPDLVVQARLDEERLAKRHLAELYDLGTDHPGFAAGLEQLRSMVLEHAEMEEREEFRAMRLAIPPGQLVEMAGRVKWAEKLAPTRPHPNTPTSAAGSRITGPPMAVFDRIRDAIRDGREHRDH
jgi:rhamnose utilization protein RhaD (predicted bifunctional aldolase and dehydrogenase)